MRQSRNDRMCSDFSDELLDVLVHVGGRLVSVNEIRVGKIFL